MPLMGDPGHLEMISTLTAIASSINKPSAIVVVSAHWEESVVTVTSGEKPGLVYDYFGFPDEAYAVEYPSPGEPQLAQRIVDALTTSGIKANLDDRRGFDHGHFVPLKIMYPLGDIPCVQLSLIKGLDPAQHLDIGKALGKTLDESVLILGSGSSFHNMQGFFDPDNKDADAQNAAFESWLQGTCTSPALSEDERSDRLIQWPNAPGARYCHPREEHLLPLHVCYGTARKAATKSWSVDILGKKMSMFLWSTRRNDNGGDEDSSRAACSKEE
jgi:4,5-DOPA dioxygenase extradiol